MSMSETWAIETELQVTVTLTYFKWTRLYFQDLMCFCSDTPIYISSLFFIENLLLVAFLSVCMLEIIPREGTLEGWNQKPKDIYSD